MVGEKELPNVVGEVAGNEAEVVNRRDRTGLGRKPEVGDPWAFISVLAAARRSQTRTSSAGSAVSSKAVGTDAHNGDAPFWTPGIFVKHVAAHLRVRSRCSMKTQPNQNRPHKIN